MAHHSGGGGGGGEKGIGSWVQLLSKTAPVVFSVHFSTTLLSYIYLIYLNVTIIILLVSTKFRKYLGYCTTIIFILLILIDIYTYLIYTILMSPEAL